MSVYREEIWLEVKREHEAAARAGRAASAELPGVTGKLDDPEGTVRQRAALELGRMGKPEAVKALSDHLLDKEPETRAAVLQALFWLVQRDPGAAKQLQPMVPKLEQQYASDRGRQDYAATNEELRRLTTEVRRRS